MTFSFEVLRERVDRIAERIEELGGLVREVTIKDPANQEQIDSVERELGISLPESFKYALLHFSSEFSLRWFLPDEFQLPDQYRGIFGGMPNWSLRHLVQFEEYRKGWVEQVFPNPEDDYDKVWHNKLAFLEAGNGDYFAFDLSEGGAHRIVYLSHDDGEGHGYIIANDFMELLDRWSRICFVGAEDWQWLPFVQSPESGILPDSDPAMEFRRLLGISL